MDNIAYLYISQFLISLMLSVVFLLSWHTIEHKPYTLLWSLVFALAAVNGVLNVVRGAFPSPYFYWVVVSATSILIQAFSVSAFRIRAGLAALPLGWIAYFLLLEFAVYWFTYVNYHMGLRVALVPASSAFIISYIVWLLLSHDRRRTATIIAACTVFVIYAASQLASALVVLPFPTEISEAATALYQRINLIAQPACFAGMGLFTVLILADDLAKRMQALAVTDALSQLANRRGFEESAARAIAAGRRQQRPITLILADIDRFKQVNDRYGHQAGDQIIQAFGQLLQRTTRDEDVVARIGGEEFALLLQRTTAPEAAASIERVREAVARQELPFSGQLLRVTVSFGVAEVNPDAESLDDAMEHADKALYRAKEKGRNCVEVWH